MCYTERININVYNSIQLNQSGGLEYLSFTKLSGNGEKVKLIRQLYMSKCMGTNLVLFTCFFLVNAASVGI